jgi:surface-anchored protein
MVGRLGAAAEPLVIERGHVDLVEVTRNGTGLAVAVKDDTGGSAVYRSPAQVQLRVPEASLTDVPGGAFDFLGPAGTRVHLLPQVQDPSLVWPGWSTERLSASEVVGDAVRLRLVGVEGPGNLAVFTTDQFGAPKVLMDSDGGGANEIGVPIRTHAHANWAFDTAGVHRVTIDVIGEIAGSGLTATRVTYVFLVGDATAPVPADQVPAPTTVEPGGTVVPVAGNGAGAEVAGSVSGASGVDRASTGRSTAASALARTGGDGRQLFLGGSFLLVVGVAMAGLGRSVRRRSLIARFR